MFCANCGANLPDDAVFCGACGTPVASMPGMEPQPEPKPEPTAEPAAAEDPRPEQEPATAAPKGNRTKMVAIIVSAIAAVAVIVAIILIVTNGGFGNGGGSSDSGTGTAPAKQTTTAEYSFTTHVLERHGSDEGDLANAPKFSYVQFESSENNAKLDSVNRDLKESAEDAFANKITDEIYNNPTESQQTQFFHSTYNETVTYLEGNVACVMNEDYTIAPGGAHGSPLITGRVMDLETGKDLSAESVPGISHDELGIMAWDAADRYLKANKGLYESADDAFRDLSRSDGVPDDVVSYIITPDGVVAVFQVYTIGSFAQGTPALLVCDLEGNAAKGSSEYTFAPLSGKSEVDETGTDTKIEEKKQDSKKETKTEEKTEQKQEQKQPEKQEPEPAPAPASALIDLSNSTDYHDINLFLSNFAEWESFYKYGNSFNRDSYDLEQLVNWGMWHNAINNDGTLIREQTVLPEAPDTEASQGIDGLDPKTYLRHMETARIEKSIKRYMGIDVDLAGYSDGTGRYYEQGGQMYEGIYRGDAPAVRDVSLASSVEDLGGNQARVHFTIYCEYGPNCIKIVDDKSWYGLSGDALEQAMIADGAPGVDKHEGTAVVEVVGSGSDRSFKLVSFEVEA